MNALSPSSVAAATAAAAAAPASSTVASTASVHPFSIPILTASSALVSALAATTPTLNASGGATGGDVDSELSTPGSPPLELTHLLRALVRSAGVLPGALDSESTMVVLLGGCMCDTVCGSGGVSAGYPTTTRGKAYAEAMVGAGGEGVIVGAMSSAGAGEEVLRLGAKALIALGVKSQTSLILERIEEGAKAVPAWLEAGWDGRSGEVVDLIAALCGNMKSLGVAVAAGGGGGGGGGSSSTDQLQQQPPTSSYASPRAKGGSASSSSSSSSAGSGGWDPTASITTSISGGGGFIPLSVEQLSSLPDLGAPLTSACNTVWRAVFAVVREDLSAAANPLEGSGSSSASGGLSNGPLRVSRSDVLSVGAQLAGRMGGLGASVAAAVAASSGSLPPSLVALWELSVDPVMSLLSSVAFAAPGVCEVRVIEALGRACELVVAAYGVPALVACVGDALLSSLQTLRIHLAVEAGKEGAREAAIASGGVGSGGGGGGGGGLGGSSTAIVGGSGSSGSGSSSSSNNNNSAWDPVDLKRARMCVANALKCIVGATRGALIPVVTAVTSSAPLASATAVIAPLLANPVACAELLCCAAEVGGGGGGGGGGEGLA